ncbi:MAG: alpha-glucosidase/alpha-galactosidase [Ruminococcaceae bacterium]|nr:alpha-glucosidase/alpha-galactosidase [Oscillospiraceae bacterium]
MYYDENKALDVKIAYIGGGSRGWAWKLMSDLALEKSFCGTVALYDTCMDAAENNAEIGNRICRDFPDASPWKYKAHEKLSDALTGADFVVISILPGTFDEMQSDVHTPESYGIYQSVGDTVGPGGILRALRTIPMYEKIAHAIRDFCPDAWVISYTNPMTLCTDALYRAFPRIKAFGCCHEVFTTQTAFMKYLKKAEGITDIKRSDIKLHITGINHFTWVTRAQYKNIDLFPLYPKLFEPLGDGKPIWNTADASIKLDLYRRYGYIAAAGDSHLVEFCPGNWYLNSDATRKGFNIYLKLVSNRKKDLAERLKKSQDLLDGTLPFEMTPSGEEGVLQMKALLGLGDIVTNVNLPNYGQIPNLPLGAVVETNAHFCANTVTPLQTGALPASLYALIAPIVAEQQIIGDAAQNRDLELAFLAFCKDALVTIPTSDARKLFDKMVENTKPYLSEYFR